MKLKNVAKYFDRTKAVDAYNPRASFKCQIEPLDMYRTDGARLKIRNMSTAPDVCIPVRRVIKVDDQPYLVSDRSEDHWDGDALRARYVIQGADDLIEIRSIAQVLSETPGTQAFASIDFSKYATDERDSSEYHPQYHIFFGNEEVSDNDILEDQKGTIYLVRFSRRSQAGMVDAVSNRVEDGLASATLTSRVYNPITDGYLTVQATSPCLLVRWQEHFEYISQASAKYEKGDGQMFLPVGSVLAVNDTIEVSGETWRVLAISTKNGYLSVHVRRA